MDKKTELYKELRQLNRSMRRKHMSQRTDETTDDPRHFDKRNHRGHRGRRHMMHDRRVSHGQFQYLRVLSENEGLSQKDLAELLDLRPSSMTEITTRLEDEKLIERVKDESDKRVSLIVITELGRNTINERREERNKLEMDFLKDLSDEEIDTILPIIKKLNKSE